MALVKCKDCKREISTEAFACPHCGAPIAQNNNQLNRFEWRGHIYDIADIVRMLNWRDLTSAKREIRSVFNCAIFDNENPNVDQQIIYRIWNKYIQFQSAMHPDTEPTNIPKYNCNGYACEIYRVFWWLERQDIQKAALEIRFAFPFGGYQNANEEVEKINQIYQDIDKIYEQILKTDGYIVYPAWFLAWKHQTNERTEKRIEEKMMPRCPTCGSTNIQKHGLAARAIDGFFFGGLSVEGRAQFICKKCGFMW